MMYYLIDPSLLERKGVTNYEKMPDGRAVIDGSTLKALGRVPQVEVLPSAMAVKELKEQQNKEAGK